MTMDFFKGCPYIIRGCREFYGNPASWKYAVLPVGTMLLVYCLVFAGVLYLAGMAADAVCRLMVDLPSWVSALDSVAVVLVYLAGVISGLIFIGMSVCTFYELFGGFFFDGLVQYHEQKKYGFYVKKRPFSCEVRYAMDSVRFGIMTFVYFLLFFAASLFFPVIGQILLIGFTGYFMAISYMICPANNMGYSIMQLRTAAAKKHNVVLGFGVGAYLLMLIPFAVLFILPGLVLGGAELFYDEISKELPQPVKEGQLRIDGQD